MPVLLFAIGPSLKAAGRKHQRREVKLTVHHGYQTSWVGLNEHATVTFNDECDFVTVTNAWRDHLDELA